MWLSPSPALPAERLDCAEEPGCQTPQGPAPGMPVLGRAGERSRSAGQPWLGWSWPWLWPCRGGSLRAGQEQCQSQEVSAVMQTCKGRAVVALGGCLHQRWSVLLVLGES